MSLSYTCRNLRHLQSEEFNVPDVLYSDFTLGNPLTFSNGLVKASVTKGDQGCNDIRKFVFDWFSFNGDRAPLTISN